jgi:hypothetical protein
MKPDLSMVKIVQRDTREFVHRIDARGSIVAVNSDWLAFAAENGGPASEGELLDTRLTQYIQDAETQHIYALLAQRVRSDKGTVRFPYRCDSPDCRRYFEMNVLYRPDDDQIEFRSRVLYLEPRPAVALLDAAQPRSFSEILNLCGWCKRVQTGGLWLEVEEAVRRLGLFDSVQLPRLSHGICPACVHGLESEGIRL